MNEKKKGYVDHIIFRNDENGYTVLVLASKPDNICCVGNLPDVHEGEYLELEGSRVFHSTYGEQFKITKYVASIPKELSALEKYLGSGIIRGIGPTLAARIIEKFGDDTMYIMEQEPERLAEIKGISRRIAGQIASQMEEQSQLSDEMIFLSNYGIPLSLCIKIQKKYKDNVYEVLQNNPYALAEDIQGIGFKTADMIAARVGIDKESPFRIKSGFLYVLARALDEGHIYLPKDELDTKTAQLLDIDEALLEECFTQLVLERKLVAKNCVPEDGYTERVNVYTYQNYFLELSVALKLKELNVITQEDEEFTDDIIRSIERNSDISLDELQRHAVFCVARRGVFILTGGPGTGKTTTINAIIRYFEALGKSVLLAAPTGRAAKRMQEATGYEASTIHRMLEQYGDPDDPSAKVRFGRNEENPLEADVIIIDEASMIDIFLMNALLNAVASDTRLVFVGDVNQLPSVGPGRVLLDMIESGIFEVVTLNKIFRQAALSDIVVNAHKINNGEHLTVNNKSKDFFFMERDNAEVVQKLVVKLLYDNLPRYLNVKSSDIQVITPTRKGPLGVEALNVLLQKYLNPPDESKAEHEHSAGLFRVGDKVMQIKNNYQLEWEVRSDNDIVICESAGVYNGDTGIIKHINKFYETLTVEFDDGRVAVYDFKQLGELELAYAITVHKAQGSEYTAVVMPVLGVPKPLLTRNLLYTAVTRAKSMAVLIGSMRLVDEMVDNETQDKRYTSLTEQLIS